MFSIDYDNTGAKDALCSIATLSIYEQEFGCDMIQDVMGKIDLSESGVEIVTAEFVEELLVQANAGKELPKTTKALIERAFPTRINTVIDYTQDNWLKYVQALWAMLKTADEFKHTHTVPAYKQWIMTVKDIDVKGLSFIVCEAIQNGCFRYGVTTSTK